MLISLEGFFVKWSNKFVKFILLWWVCWPVLIYDGACLFNFCVFLHVFYYYVHIWCSFPLLCPRGQYFSRIMYRKMALCIFLTIFTGFRSGRVWVAKVSICVVATLKSIFVCSFPIFVFLIFFETLNGI